jgi:hypothetical protein
MTLFPTTTGEEWPTPTVTFHPGRRASGQLDGRPEGDAMPSRFGPRH